MKKTFYYTSTWLALLTVGAQIYPPLRLSWPVPAYDVFASSFREAKYPYMELIDDKGRIVPAAPGNVFPIESFIANRFAIERFTMPEPFAAQQLTRNLLRRLNSEPWGDRQGIFPPARAEPGSSFVGLRFYFATFDFENYRGKVPPEPVQKTLVFDSLTHFGALE